MHKILYYKNKVLSKYCRIFTKLYTSDGKIKRYFVILRKVFFKYLILYEKCVKLRGQFMQLGELFVMYFLL